MGHKMAQWPSGNSKLVPSCSYHERGCVPWSGTLLPARRRQVSPPCPTSFGLADPEESRTPLVSSDAGPRRLPSSRPPTASTRRPPRRPPAARQAASKCGTRSLESSTPSTAHCASGLCAVRMAPARFFTSADASHPAAAISRKELCEREVDEARPWARRHARGERLSSSASSARRQKTCRTLKLN